MRALQQLSTRAFQIAAAAATSHPACVPARAALFKLYLAAAAPVEEMCGMAEALCTSFEGDRDRERARAAVCALRDALVSMDPIHAGWYHAAAARVAAGRRGPDNANLSA